MCTTKHNLCHGTAPDEDYVILDSVLILLKQFDRPPTYDTLVRTLRQAFFIPRMPRMCDMRKRNDLALACMETALIYNNDTDQGLCPHAPSAWCHYLAVEITIEVLRMITQ